MCLFSVRKLFVTCNILSYTQSPDLMLPGVVGSDRGGLSVEGIARGQTCAINLVGNRYL